MIEIEINGKTKKIETELTISKFQDLNTKIDKMTEPGSMLAFYMDMELKQVRALPKSKVDFVERFIATEIAKPTSEELVLTFTHKGIEYGMENDWSKLAWGAWQDFEILSADNPINKIHHIMAILYRPVVKKDGTKYVIEPYNEDTILERMEEFKELPVKFWFGASAFFFQIVASYITDIKSSLVLETKMNKLAMIAWKKLPSFLKPKRLQDSIFNSPTHFRVKI